MRHLFLIYLLFVLATALGCGSAEEPGPATPAPPSPKALIKQQINILNEMATALENGASEKEMKTFENRSKELNIRIEELGLSPRQKQEILKEHQAEMQAALDRIRTEMEKRVKSAQQ